MVGRARRTVRPGSAGLGSQDAHSRDDRESADPSLARWASRRPVPAHHASGWQTARRSQYARARFAGRQPRPVSLEGRASEIRLDRHWYLQGGLVGKERVRILGADQLPQLASAPEGPLRELIGAENPNSFFANQPALQIPVAVKPDF